MLGICCAVAGSQRYCSQLSLLGVFYAHLKVLFFFFFIQGKGQNYVLARSYL